MVSIRLELSSVDSKVSIRLELSSVDSKVSIRLELFSIDSNSQYYTQSVFSMYQWSVLDSSCLHYIAMVSIIYYKQKAIHTKFHFYDPILVHWTTL